MVNEYCQKHKERLWKQAIERHQNLSEEERDKRRKKARESYKTLLKNKRKKASVLSGK